MKLRFDANQLGSTRQLRETHDKVATRLATNLRHDERRVWDGRGYTGSMPGEIEDGLRFDDESDRDAMFARGAKDREK